MSDRIIKLHRIFKDAPAKFYRAFLNPDANAKWIATHDFTFKVHELDAKVGGYFKMSFTNFTTIMPTQPTQLRRH